MSSVPYKNKQDLYAAQKRWREKRKIALEVVETQKAEVNRLKAENQLFEVLTKARGEKANE